MGKRETWESKDEPGGYSSEQHAKPGWKWDLWGKERPGDTVKEQNLGWVLPKEKGEEQSKINPKLPSLAWKMKTGVIPSFSFTVCLLCAKHGLVATDAEIKSDLLHSWKERR